MSNFMNLSKVDPDMKSNIMETNFEIPQNIDAEQALLGALLVNNEIYDKINNILKIEHFYDPVHQKIYEICAEKISRNSLASPVTLTTVRNISNILSTAKIKAIPSGSIPIALNTITNITIPAPGTAAAPIDDKVAVITITIWSVNVKS